MQEKVQEQAGQVQEAVEQVQEQAQDVVEDVQEQVQDVVEAVQEQVQDVVEDVQEQAQDVVENIQEQVAQPAAAPAPQRPAVQIPTNRSWAKLVFLGILTLGIYPLVIMSKISENINTIASPYDGKHTMHYCLLFFIIAPITLGIGAIVWQHKISNRIGNELQRRNIDYTFSAKSYWGWAVLGALICVGPFIYLHKFCKSMNLLAADYNERG